MVRPDALFLDIDGTILRTDHSLSERVIRAVGAIGEAGTLVCPATGRSWEALEPLYDRLSLDGPAVCYNGAFVAEGPGGDALFEVTMDEEAARPRRGTGFFASSLWGFEFRCSGFRVCFSVRELGDALYT